MFVDSHAHISNYFYDNIDEIYELIKNNDVLKVVNCATNKNEFNELINLSKYDIFYYALGVHPEEIKDSFISENEFEDIIKRNTSNEKFVAVGEIGLDYYHDKTNISEQKELFEMQLKIAEKYKLPVIIHSREATEDTINILNNYKLKGIIHCFSGSIETARKYINMGYKIGVGGLVTFKNCNLNEKISEIGIKNIVLETDSPFMTPEPFRKHKNDSSYIPVIAKKISEILSLDIEDVANITSNNCDIIFDFNKQN